MSVVLNQSEGPQGSGISFCTRKRDVWSREGKQEDGH